jgi:carbamoyl-phosphate synthase large subunit
MIYPIRVLVTAVGGDLGQALVKALRLSKDPLQIFGCDADINGIGPVFTNSYHVVPLAKETTRYLESLNSLCRSLKIQVVIPGSEPEISILCRLGSPPRLECGAIVVCQEAAWFDIYGDKLHTMQALEGKIKLAPFADGNDSQAVDHLLAQVGFPLVVKSRRSSGSRTLRVAHNKYELTKYIEEISLPLVQQYIDATRGEYRLRRLLFSSVNSGR